MNSNLHIDGTLILRKVANEFLLVPINETALKLNGMISISESAALLWNVLEKGCQKSDLIEILLNEYEIDYESAETDIDRFLGQLRELHLLKEE